MKLSLVALATCIASSHGVHAAPEAKLTWWKRPVDKYKCTRYSPGQPNADATTVYAPPGKPMIFSIAARAGRQRVTYRAEGLPTGATVDTKTGKFSWTIPATATGTSKVKLVAESGTSRIETALDIVIADPDVVLAWKSGMGSMQPDCENYLVGHEFVDVDGDGKKDVAWETGMLGDDSASPKRVMSIRLRTPKGFDTVKREIAGGDIEAIKTPDNKPAIIVSRSCCCMATYEIHRVTSSGVDSLGSMTTDACGGSSSSPAGPLSTETDAKDRVIRIVSENGDAWKWNGSTFSHE